MLELRDVKKSYPEPDGGRLRILDIPHFAVKEGEQMVNTVASGGILRVDKASVAKK